MAPRRTGYGDQPQDAACSRRDEQAIGQRKPSDIIHHSGQGSQYTSVAFGLRCKEAGVRPSMGSVGHAYDNACTIVARTNGATWLIASASSPPSNASSWTGANSRQRPKPAWRSSSLSRDGAIPDAVTRLWDISHPATTKGKPSRRWSSLARNRPRNRGNSNATTVLLRCRLRPDAVEKLTIEGCWDR